MNSIEKAVREHSEALDEYMKNRLKLITMDQFHDVVMADTRIFNSMRSFFKTMVDK